MNTKHSILFSTAPNEDEAAKIHSVILHETETGYAQCFREDAYSEAMGLIDLQKVVFSPAVKADWRDTKMWDKVVGGGRFKVKAPVQQVKAVVRPAFQPRSR